MDNLTHTLFAVTLGRTALSRAGRGTTAVLVLGSNAPDLDAVSLLGGPLGYLDWHRGPTHGPLGVIVLGALSAGLIWTVGRWRDRQGPADAGRPRASLAVLAALGMLAAALHIAMDLPTSYGTRVLSPFNEHWHTTDWMPIADVYLLALLGAGLAAGRWVGARRATALAVLLLMAANYGLRGVAHGRAVAAVPQAFGPRLPPPCADAMPAATLGRWPRRPRLPPDAPAAACLVDVAAIPTFLSPFRWQLIARTSNAYEVQVVDVLDGSRETRRPWHLARRVPDQWTPAVVRAAESDVGRRFLSFSRYPAARSVLEPDGTTTVRWVDMRFAATPETPRGSPNRRSLFSATVRIASDGTILDQKLGD